MYIVGWRPQTSNVAQQVSSAKPGAQPVVSAEASSHQSADADAGPTSTGAIGPGRSATRTVRRIDGVASPTGSEPAAERAQDVAAASDRGAAGARPNVPNAKPALSPPANPPAGSAKKPEIVRLPVGDDAEADPTAQRTQAAERRTNDRGAALGTPTRRRRHRATPLSHGLDPKPRLLRGRRITERAASLTRRAPRLRQRLPTPLALPVRHGRTGERRAPPSARLAQPRGRRSGPVLPTRARARRRFVAGCWRPVSKLARSVARPARSRARGWPATAA